MNETTIINMFDYVNNNQQEQYELVCMHGRTMVMMYQVTGESRYLRRARLDLQQAKTILRGGHMRPIGVLLFKSA